MIFFIVETELEWLSSEVVFYLMISVLWGGVIGALQWLCLRRRVPQAAWWIPVKIVTWLFIFFVLSIAGSMFIETTIVVTDHHDIGTPEYTDFTISAWFWPTVLTAVFTTGIIQWLFLRRRVALAGWWIPISFISYCAAGYLTYLFSDLCFDYDFLAMPVFGLIRGLPTGFILALLMYKTKPLT
jgi:hypothetical protein